MTKTLKEWIEKIEQLKQIYHDDFWELNKCRIQATDELSSEIDHKWELCKDTEEYKDFMKTKPKAVWKIHHDDKFCSTNEYKNYRKAHYDWMAIGDV